jgi:hypothetical protein
MNIEDSFVCHSGNNIAEAKRRLYSLLLQKKNWTGSECQICYYLSQDEDIQKILEKALKRRNK